MSSGEGPSWDSLPDHLKSSRLAFAIDPEGAQAAAANLDEVLFLGRMMFHDFSRTELGAYIWRKWGQQCQAMTDAELLSWIQKIDFRDHAAFDGMRDDEVIRFLRGSASTLEDYAAQYVRSGDFPIACRGAGMEPSSRVDEQIGQARKLLCEDPILKHVLSELLMH